MYIAQFHFLNSVPVQTFRTPCSRGLHLIKDIALRFTLSTLACTTNHQLIEITKKMIYSLCYHFAINYFFGQ